MALQLRMANLLYERVKDHGGLVIVPSSFAESTAVIEKLARLAKEEERDCGCNVRCGKDECSRAFVLYFLHGLDDLRNHVRILQL